jgi:hypothetical protein
LLRLPFGVSITASASPVSGSKVGSFANDFMLKERLLQSRAQAM